MDSRDRARLRAGDLACSVCREPVSPERRRLLARREDLLFVELDCRSCASLTLGFVFAGSEGPVPDRIRLADTPPVSADDVLDMHAHLEVWQGDLRSLVDDGASSPGAAQ